MKWDVAIVGAGPAGSVCAAICARQGLKTLLLDRSSFPRDKVCGDCINPAAWRVFNRLGWTSKIRSLPSRIPGTVEFVSIAGRSISASLPISEFPEIVIRRHDLDALLADCARQHGAVFIENTTVRKIEENWKLETENTIHEAQILIAADGRNSSVCRLLGLMPKSQTDRVALQAHIPRPASLHHTIRMMLLPSGYSGLVDLSDESANLCVVSRPEHIDSMAQHAVKMLGLAETPAWRSIAPLARLPVISKQPRLFVIGDAARVVEPFTGEGIYYAMRSAETAAQEITQGFKTADWVQASHQFRKNHSAIYAKRLWINQLTRFLCERPKLGSRIIESLPFRRQLLTALTAKVSENGV